MVREFRKQSNRLDMLRRYQAIVTHSTRMREEYLRHGFDPSHVFKVPYSVGPSAHRVVTRVRDRQNAARADGHGPANAGHDEWRVLFVGRMYEIKGGRELIDALPMVANALGTRLHVTFAGDGAQKAEWERRAQALCASDPRIGIEFTGWLPQEGIDRLYDDADLVVMPSLWPEPFGLVGPEAGRHGVPVAAFAVGGIPDWLKPGVNGHLAPGDPPTVQGLADAMTACLRDEETHARLRDGAKRSWSEETFDHHVASLFDIFNGVLTAA